jgi:hypothetical protein
MPIDLTKYSLVDVIMRRLNAISAVAIILSFIAILYLSYDWWIIRTTAINEAKEVSQKQAEIARNEIDAQLKFSMLTAKEIADDITNGKLPYNQISDTLYKKLLYIREAREENQDRPKHSQFFAISAAFDKGAFDKTKPQQLMNWYYFFDKQQMKIINKARNYDYTDKKLAGQSAWFTHPAETGLDNWEEPRYGKTVQEFVAGYSIPFYTNAERKKVAGVIYINYSMAEIRKIMQERTFMKTGYGVVFSKKGKLIYHPDEMITRADHHDYKNEKIDAILGNENLKSISFLQNIQKDAQYTLPNNERVWIFSSIIPSSQWQLKVVFLMDELGLKEKSLHNQLHVIDAVVIFFLSLLLRVFVLYRNNQRILWLISLAITVIFILAIARLWSLSNALPATLPEEMVKLRSKEKIDAFEKDYNKVAEVLELEKPIYVPTGVFFKSAQFDGANNVTVNAYVWQKYHYGVKALKELKNTDDICNYQSKDVPKTKGVSFVEAIETQIDYNCPQASYFNHDTVGNLTIGWYVKLNLRQSFDYSKYPFDKNIIWLRMVHSEFERNCVLKPDIYAYSLLYQGAKSGIDWQGFILPGWNLIGSYFSAITSAYSSNWGIEDFVGQVTPELYFNVEIKRNFLDPFISGITPVIMVFLVLFIMLFASSDDDTVAGKFGFNAMAVFGILAGLLFSVALWHGGLRGTLGSSKISYFECFFIVCYFLIGVVGLNSLILSSQYPVKWLRYKENLVMKLSFLPVIATVLYFVTLIMLFD